MRECYSRPGPGLGGHFEPVDSPGGWRYIPRLPSVSSQEHVHRLVALIYEAALDSSLWPRFLEALGEAIHGHTLVLSSITTRPELTIEATGRADPEFFGIYNSHYRDSDPWLIAGLASGRMRPGAAALAEEILPREAFRKTAYFSHMTPRFKSYGGAAVILARHGGIGGLSAHQFRFDQFGESEKALFALLGPHVERALMVHNRMSGIERQRDAAAHVLDRISTAIILVSATGTPVLINAAASRMLQKADGLVSERDALVTRRADETRDLRSLIAECARTSAGAGLATGGVMRVTRADPKPPLHLLVSPLRIGPGLAAAAASAAAAIFVHDPSVTPALDANTLARLYGLTDAEARVAAALARALAPADIARTLGISVHTVRTHLRRLFDKTGTAGQTQLLQLLLSGPAAVIHLGDVHGDGPG